MYLLNERLKELRKRENLTQNEIAKKLGIQPTTYGEYERGNILPPIDKLTALAKLYDVSIDYIIGEREQTPKQDTTIDISLLINKLITDVQSNPDKYNYKGSKLKPKCVDIIVHCFESVQKSLEIIGCSK